MELRKVKDPELEKQLKRNGRTEEEAEALVAESRYIKWPKPSKVAYETFALLCFTIFVTALASAGSRLGLDIVTFLLKTF